MKWKMNRRRFLKQTGTISCFEYEYHWENSLPEIAQSVVYSDKVASEIAAKS